MPLEEAASEELALIRVGAFASYYNGRADLIELMEIFHCTGRGYDLHNELNRLAKEQALRQWSA